jgi:hypothetical protein
VPLPASIPSPSKGDVTGKSEPVSAPQEMRPKAAAL